jgi:type I restriction enzyme S subunit
VPTEAELARAEGRDYEPASVLLERILAERRRRWEEAEMAKMKAKGRTPKDDKWKAKYKEPVAPDSGSLPELPGGWCWSTVDQLASVGTGTTPKRGDSRFWNGGDVPWVTSAVVNDKLVQAPSEYVTRAALAETNLSLYPRGTLLIAMYGEGKTRGRATVLGIEASTNQALAALELPGASQQVRGWLFRFFEHNYLELRRSASGGVQPNLNLGIVRSICVPLPPIREQVRIVAEIDRSLSIAAAAQDSVASSVVKVARLRRSILKWAFEGRLVDQDPTDEPASILLERIRAEREAKPAQRARTPRRARAAKTDRP